MRVQILSAEGAQYLNFAKQKLQVLDALRGDAGLERLQKYIFVADFLIFLRADSSDPLIRIEGGGHDFILLHTGRSVWGYNYKTNQLLKRLGLSSSDTFDQAAPAHLDLGEERLTAQNGRVLHREAAELFDTTTPIPRLATAASRLGNAVTIRTGGDITLPVRENFNWGDLATMQGQLYPTGAYSEVWNQLKGPEAWQVNLVNGAAIPSRWKWTPRIWFPEQGNLVYPSGIYYGKAFGDAVGPAEEVRCRFGALLDDRLDRDSAREGYCEILTKVDATAYRTAYFFLQLWEAGRASFYYVNSLTEKKYVHNAVWDTQPTADFTIDYLGLLGEQNIDLHWWTSQAEDDGNPNMLLGIVAWAPDGRYAVHRYRGYTELLAQGANYRGHSVSSNGQVVAVFTGVSAIDSVWVYDIAKHKVLRERSLSGFVAGAIIPAEIKDTGPPPVLTLTLADSSQYKFGASIGGAEIPWPTYHSYRLTGWKVLSDGREAIGKLWADDCWSVATMSVITPADYDNTARPHSVAIDGTTYSASTFGALAAELPFLLYSVDGLGVNKEIGMASWTSDGLPQAVSVTAGTNTSVYTLQRNSISISADEQGVLSASANAKAPLQWSGDVLEVAGEFQIDTPQCDGVASVHLTDACGLSVDLDVAAPNDPVTVSGNSTVTVGAIYTASGGVGPYIMSATGVTVTDNGDGTAEVTEVGCTSGQIIAEDSCGATGYKAVNGTPTVSALTISGTDTPSVGSTYTASGGMSPYTFSISCGTINASTGQVTDLTGCCGSGTVTVTDSCGTSANKTVRFPTGQWVQTSVESQEYPCNVLTICMFNSSCSGNSSVTDNLISGDTKIEEEFTYTYPSPPTGCPSLGSKQTTNYPASVVCTSGSCWGGVPTTIYPYVVARHTYEWQCP